MDFDVEWKDYRCRLIRCRVPSEEKIITWLTNLPRNAFSYNEIMLLYRTRWQIELLFKELKSYNNLKKFNIQRAA